MFLDIGANIGAYALFVAGFTGPRARILAVEPQPTCSTGSPSISGRTRSGRSRPSPARWPTRRGELTLFIDPRNRGESSVKIVGTQKNAAVRVPAVTRSACAARRGSSGSMRSARRGGGGGYQILEPFLREAPASLHPALIVLETARTSGRSICPACSNPMATRQIARTRLNLMFERAGGGAPGVRIGTGAAISTPPGPTAQV